MLEQERSLFSSPLLLFISLGFLLLPLVVSQIPLGSRLSVKENNYWVSQNGDFAVGFFSRSNQYSIGIRYNSRSIPSAKQIVVWVAGAELTVGDRSYFELNQNGELILFDSTKGVIAWESKTGDSSVSSAILNDDGNLVLLNRKNDVVWQSFNTPSDTLLPGQNLSGSQMLRAASGNSLTSYYSLRMDAFPPLQLRWESNVSYWNSGSPSQSTLRAILSSEGTFQLLDQKSKSVWSIFGEDHNDSNVKFRFLRLDADGNLRLYSWIEDSSSWRTVWQAIDNQCNVFATCGKYGICIFNASGSPVCRCPFTPTSESNLKCLAPYRQDCESGSTVVTYEHTSLYGIYPPGEMVTQTSLQQCKILCQKDPLCTAATFTDDGTAECRTTNTRYIGGQSGPSLNSISFVKRCSDPLAVLPIYPKPTPYSTQYTPPTRSHKFCIPCLIGLVVGTFLVVFIIQLGIGFYMYKRRRKKAALSCIGPHGKSFILLSYPEILEITENFKHQIGPKMFQGMLSSNRPVAVKNLNIAIEERKFRSTATKVGSIYHRNLVKLEGYCSEAGHRFLVYEFASKGSLGNCLADPKMFRRLTWRKRMEICSTVARAISYLHTGCREFTSHGNLKCENVVLDDNLEARVSEFGLGGILGEASCSGGLAERDVRNFGMMLLFLVSGRQNSDDVEWAYQEWLGARAEKVADARIEGGVDPNELERALRVAFWCLQVDERMRPSMGEVVKVLEGTLAVDPPPPPFASRKAPGEEESIESDPEP